MKHLLLILVVLYAACINPSKSADVPKPWINNTGRYIYSVEITQAGQSISTDTLALYILDEPSTILKSKGQMQWQPVTFSNGNYVLIDSDYQSYVTGTHYNDSMFYIHPPREDKYKVLQFAPHPYILFKEPGNKKWYWELPIGKVWSLDSIYKIDNVDTSKIVYEAKSNTVIYYRGEMIDCLVIEATAELKGRRSYAHFAYNYSIGLISMSIRFENGMAYDMSLVDQCKGLDCIGDNKELMYSHNYRHKQRSGKWY